MKTCQPQKKKVSHFCVYFLVLILALLITNETFAQVGINTTNPDPSAMLDINTPDKGLLIPRVSLNDITNTMLDGTNTAATGLLIYNTNPLVTGGNGIGYYSFNGSSWEKLITTGTSLSDHDFYEEGTTSPPNDITDDIFTQGNIAIGKTTTNYRLDIEESSAERGINLLMSGTTNSTMSGSYTEINNTGTGAHIGAYNLLTGTNAASQVGTFNSINNSSDANQNGSVNVVSGSGSGIHRGTRNTLIGTGNGNQLTISNLITNSGSGNHFGLFNAISGGGSGTQYGVSNNVSVSGDGVHYGSYNNLTGSGSGNKFGLYSRMSSTAGGLHYGIYSEALKTGSFAGLFLGNVAIGTNLFNTYTFPASRGLNNQVMQTDATGNISWVDGSSLGSEDADFYESGTTTAPDAITDNIFHIGDASFGVDTTGPKLSVFDNSTDTEPSVEITRQGNNFNTYGLSINATISNTGGAIYNDVNGTITSGRSLYGVVNDLADVTGSGVANMSGVHNILSSNSSIPISGMSSTFLGTGNNNKNGVVNGYGNLAGGNNIGVGNTFNSVANTFKYGMLNTYGQSSGGTIMGLRNNIYATNTSAKYGVYNNFNGFNLASPAPNGVMFGVYNTFDPDITGNFNKYGTYTIIPSTVAGINYGIYSDVRATNGYAGYFLGRVSIGTTNANNYIFPSSRGTNNQVMQTNAAGIVNWVDSSSLGSEDVDFYAEGTTTAPTSINDDIFTQGNVGIGDTTPDYALDVFEDSGTRAMNIRLNSSDNSQTSSVVYVHNSNTGSTAAKNGLYTYFNGSNNGNKYGVQNYNINSGTGLQTGVYNVMSSSSDGNISGIQNVIGNSGDGIHYGTISELSGTGSGTKYGSYNAINTTAGGTHYGVYSRATKSGSYAGYFLGSVTIGTTTTNRYILPASRGTNGQVMQTNATGTVNWVDVPNNSFWSRTGTNLDVATAADDISFASDQTSITFPSTNGTPSSMIYMFGGGTSNSNRMILSQSPLFSGWGLEYRDSGDSFVFKSATTDRVEIDLAGGFPLRVFGTARAANFQSDTTTYPDYVFENYYTGTSSLNDQYNFKTLSEIEKFIKENGHLPGVKSYDEIEAQGMTIDLAETSVINLEKIEELYLHTIELKKENESLKATLKLQEERLQKIEALLVKE